MKIAVTGDIMLGRHVDLYVVRNASVPPEAIWGDVLPLLSSANLRLGNLECVISTRGKKWRPLIKPFHFRAHARAIEILQAAQFNCVTLANNHTLDYGPEALLDCLSLLDQARVPHAGAGPHLNAAITPAFLETPNGRLAVIALTDNEPRWEATPTQPGVNHVSFDSQGLVPPYRSRIAEVIREARRQVEFVIISAHVGPNWGEPSQEMQALAHQLLDLGADLYWGHSNHTPRGIEIYKKKPILYSTGDFVDDYAVDPEERNDLTFLFMIEMDFRRVARIQLYPVRIETFSVRRAKGPEAFFLQKSMQSRCAAFGTKIDFQENIGTIVFK